MKILTNVLYMNHLSKTSMYALAGDFFTNFEEDLDECVVYNLSLQNIDVRTNVVFYRFHTNVRQGARSKNRRAAGTSPRGRLQSGRPKGWRAVLDR